MMLGAVHSQLSRALEQQKKTPLKQTFKTWNEFQYNMLTKDLLQLPRRRYSPVEAMSLREHQGVSGGLGEGQEP